MDRLANIFVAEKGGYFVWVPVLMGLGISGYFQLKVEPSSLYAVTSAFLVLAAFVSVIYERKLLFLILVLLCITIGFTAAQLRTISVHTYILSSKITGIVSGEVLETSYGHRKVRLVLGEVLDKNEKLNGIQNIRVTVRGNAPEYVVGDRVEGLMTLHPPAEPAYPGAFDFQRHLFFQSIGAVGYALKPPKIIKKTSRMSMSLEETRREISQHIVEHTFANVRGFILAITTGDKGYLDKDVTENMRQSGLAHLLAISGLHMVLVGGSVFFAIRLLLSLIQPVALRYPIKKWAAVFALFAITGYYLFSGMSVSATRAFIMISLIFIAILFDRNAISIRNLSIAAIIILLLKPESLLSPGFQMSFSAVFCLIYIYEKYGDRLYHWTVEWGVLSKLFAYIGGIMVTSLVASFATAPFAIYHFGGFSIVGVFANLVAVPIMGLWCMPLIALSYVGMLLGFSEIPLSLSGYGIEFIQKVAQVSADLDGGYLQLSGYSLFLLSALVFSAIWFSCWKGRIRWLAAIILSVGILYQWQLTLPDILVSKSGKLLMVRAGEEYVVSDFRSDRRARKQWAVLYGVDEFVKPEKSDCDALGCIWVVADNKVAYSRNWYGLRVDCEKADIVISQVPISNFCEKPLISIGKFDLWRNGSHAIYLKDEGYRVETVADIRGNRPWVP